MRGYAPPVEHPPPPFLIPQRYAHERLCAFARQCRAEDSGEEELPFCGCVQRHSGVVQPGSRAQAHARRRQLLLVGDWRKDGAAVRQTALPPSPGIASTPPRYDRIFVGGAVPRVEGGGADLNDLLFSLLKPGGVMVRPENGGLIRIEAAVVQGAVTASAPRPLRRLQG